jgi:hypothetical protein
MCNTRIKRGQQPYQHSTMTDATGNEVHWVVGQRILVSCPSSKHHGRYAHITDVSRKRLGLLFEDGRPGKFIDKSRAVIVNDPSVASPSTVIDNAPVTPQGRPHVTNNNGDRDMTELSRLLDHMAFTVATLISSNAEDPATVSRTLEDFQIAVRDNTRIISRRRRERSQGPN